MLDLLLIANYRPTAVYVPSNSLENLITKSYLPLIEACEQSSWHVIHCMDNMFLSNTLSLYPNFIKKLNDLAKMQMAEFSTKIFCSAWAHTFTPAEMQIHLYSYREQEMDAWSRPAHGFFPTEGWLDPFVVSTLFKSGAQWGIISGSTLPNERPAVSQYQLLQIPSLEYEHRIPCVCLLDDPKTTELMYEILTGKVDVKVLVNHIFTTIPKLDQPILALSIPMEVPFLSNDPSMVIQRLRLFLQFLERAMILRITSMSQILQKHTTPECPSWIFNDVRYWNRLQQVITQAKTAIEHAATKHPYSKDIKTAWYTLMNSQDYEVYRGLTAPVKGMTSFTLHRYLQACNFAMQAFQQAQFILESK